MTLAKFVIKESFGVARRGSFVQCGFPLNRVSDQREFDASELELRDSTAKAIPAEFVFLNRSKSDQTQWVKVSFLCNSTGNSENEYSVHFAKNEVPKKRIVPAADSEKKLKLSRNPLDSEVLSLSFGTQKIQLKLSVINLKNVKSYIRWRDIGQSLTHSLHGTETVVSLAKFESKLEFRLEFLLIPSNASVRIRVTVHNKNRATHPNGFWDLGDTNSENIRAINFECESLVNANQPSTLWNSADQNSHKVFDGFSLLQLGSGSVRNISRAHLNSAGVIACDSHGFELKSKTNVDLGKKFSPTLIKQSGDESVSFSFPEFWQRFPSGLSSEGSKTNWHFLPQWQFDHEIQAGEKCSKEMWISFAGENLPATSHFPLVALPILNRANRGVDWGVERYEEITPTLDKYLTEMVDGASDFFKKREQIDEYGWRNFGDVWADHEEPFANGEKPVISHYNNQYDLLHSLLLAFLRSGDKRWWDLAEPLAVHVINIDLYDTYLDKAGFNQGLFWHTAHYQDAGTASHRSYSLAMSKTERHRVNGGGPGSNEQAYSSGLRLYFQMTGDQRAQRAVINLADWIIAMDDGSRSILAPLSGLPTGKASSTALANYHGPGRGAGNAINCLLDAWLLTNADKYLDKAHEIIQRVIHPDDDVESLDLLNAELRWSYTVFLQSLFKYLEATVSVELSLKSYVEASLCTYGEWMLKNEGLYFDRVKELEFPTETWHAQDLRKANMLVGIGRYHPEAEVARKMKERGTIIRDEAWLLLLASETRVFSRPFALALQQLPIQLYVDAPYQRPSNEGFDQIKPEWPIKARFVDQKSYVKSGLKRPSSLAGMALRSAWLPHWIPTFSEIGFLRRLKSKIGI